MVESNKKHEKTTIKKAFRVIKQNDQLAIFIGVVLAYKLVAQLLGGIFVPQNAPIIALSGILIKLGSGFTLGATTVMLADVIYYGEVKFGSRNESVIASFQTLLVKVASAVAGWLIGVGLTIVGYVPNVTQTAGTVFGMRVIMIVVPSVITILGFIIYSKGYKLQGEYQEKIMEELNNKRKYEELNAEIDKDIITT
ncbi:MFS transporter [Clostridium sp.]|uniref:MFS transporter n=1 Tax=Clostridium sp. TaxID=1506 RepID=UPI002A917B2C|nr:MFS transporter [Clostridium sp.]MDY6011963.1 MFS transporter [Clostridium sp.]